LVSDIVTCAFSAPADLGAQFQLQHLARAAVWRGGLGGCPALPTVVPLGEAEAQWETDKSSHA